MAGSSALKMHDRNVSFSRSRANEWTPVIINNACAPWYDLFAISGASSRFQLPNPKMGWASWPSANDRSRKYSAYSAT
jgi:hypothetical protein